MPTDARDLNDFYNAADNMRHLMSDRTADQLQMAIHALTRMSRDEVIARGGYSKAVMKFFAIITK